MKNVRPWSILVLIAMAAVLIHPTAAMQGAGQGVTLLLQALIPSLLPFMILCRLLTDSGLVQAAGRKLYGVTGRLFGAGGEMSLAIVLSIICGYPTGAKLVGSLYQDGRIPKERLTHHALLCSTASPVFVLATVGAGMLVQPSLGRIILVSHIAACLLLGLRPHRGRPLPPAPAAAGREAPPPPLGTALARAVADSCLAMLQVGGYVILFSVILAILRQSGWLHSLASLGAAMLSLEPASVEALLTTLLEMSNGCQAIASCGAPLRWQCAALAFAVSWGGLSIACQSLGLLSGAPIRPVRFLLGKLAQGILAAALCYMMLGFVELPAFAPIGQGIWGEAFTPVVSLAGIQLCALTLFLLWIWQEKRKKTQNFE